VGKMKGRPFPFIRFCTRCSIQKERQEAKLKRACFGMISLKRTVFAGQGQMVRAKAKAKEEDGRQRELRNLGVKEEACLFWMCRHIAQNKQINKRSAIILSHSNFQGQGRMAHAGHNAKTLLPREQCEPIKQTGQDDRRAVGTPSLISARVAL
jgi:hypothetical protein